MPGTRWFIPLVLFLATAFAGAQSDPPADTSHQPTTPANSPAPSPANASSSSKSGIGSDDTSDAGDRQTKEKPEDNDQPLKADQVHNPVLWTDPGNIAARDLFYGQGGEKHQPKPPFTFLREDMHGSNPKFDARDADRQKVAKSNLRKKRGLEVWLRGLLWAVGYFANDDYVLPQATVQGLKMHRKSSSAKGDRITYARFAANPAVRTRSVFGSGKIIHSSARASSTASA